MSKTFREVNPERRWIKEREAMVPEVIHETADTTMHVLFTCYERMDAPPRRFLTVDAHQFEELKRSTVATHAARHK